MEGRAKRLDEMEKKLEEEKRKLENERKKAKQTDASKVRYEHETIVTATYQQCIDIEIITTLCTCRELQRS